MAFWWHGELGHDIQGQETAPPHSFLLLNHPPIFFFLKILHIWDYVRSPYHLITGSLWLLFLACMPRKIRSGEVGPEEVRKERKKGGLWARMWICIQNERWTPDSTHNPCVSTDWNLEPRLQSRSWESRITPFRFGSAFQCSHTFNWRGQERRLPPSSQENQGELFPPWRIKKKVGLRRKWC